MKRSVRKLVCLVFLMAAAISGLQAQEQQAPPWLWLGLRLGITGVLAQPEDFDALIQQLQPKSRQYFPVYSEIGGFVEQRIKLGRGGYRLFLQERFLMGGLDQTMVLPSISLLAGFRTPRGLQFGIGPDFSRPGEGGDSELEPAMVYTVGYTFMLEDKEIPLILSAVPIPPEGKPRFSVLSGLDFGLDLKREKEPPPFNY
jgi:hypothetical protein